MNNGSEIQEYVLELTERPVWLDDEISFSFRAETEAALRPSTKLIRLSALLLLPN